LVDGETESITVIELGLDGEKICHRRRQPLTARFNEKDYSLPESRGVSKVEQY
jgi:hypothetical protein